MPRPREPLLSKQRIVDAATVIVPPNRYSQYEKALSRGNATSGAPICSGTM
jgi:hypothetical protein